MAVTVSMPQGGGVDHSRLERFRGEVHDCLTARSDALFELLDGLSQAIPVAGVAHLSLAAGARRGHGSGYAALRRGRVDEDMLRDVLAEYRPSDWGAVFAVDTFTWPRPDAHCSPGRGYYHQAHAKARQVAGQPVVAGWNFSLLAALAPDTSTWTAPLDVQLRTVADDATTVAAGQIRALTHRLTTGSGQPYDGQSCDDRSPDGQGRLPLFVLDAGYHPAQLTHELDGTPAQIALRIRNDRVFFTRPEIWLTRSGKPGRPQRHGTRFHCAHPASWPTPDDTATTNTRAHGRMSIQAWHRLHPERPGLRDTDDRPAIIECTLIRITVDRLPAAGHRQPAGARRTTPPPIWLWWAGPPETVCDPLHVAQAYLHRFDIEHTIRFTKQTLGLTTPKIRTPEQAHRWAWLVLTAYTQLRLAAGLVNDHRLPWQPRLEAHKITPGRVRTGFTHLLPTLRTPIRPPKPTTPGPGRPPGRKSTPAPRHTVHKAPKRKHPKGAKIR